MVTKLKMFMNLNSLGNLLTLFASLVNTVRLNVTGSTNSQPFSRNLDDREHGWIVWIKQAYMYINQVWIMGGIRGVWIEWRARA